MTAVSPTAESVADEPRVPKYIQKANRILETIAAQPDQRWTLTQRSLGETLGLAQPELSSLLKLLFEEGRLRRGRPLPGVRGRNHELEIVDPTPLREPSTRRSRSAERHPEDRALAPGETVQGTVDLGTITAEQIGLGIVRYIQQTTRKEQEFHENRSTYVTRLRDYQEQLQAARRDKERVATEREALERRLAEAEADRQHMQAEINRLLMAVQQRHGQPGHSYPVRDLIDEETLKSLDRLMRSRPGHYRESDAELDAS